MNDLYLGDRLNYLYFGDNLDVLKQHVRDECIDLVYIDPPFNSDEIYNLSSSGSDGTVQNARIQVFNDTWHWNAVVNALHAGLVAKHDKVAGLMVSFKKLLGESNLLAYLVMMAPRLVELHRVLKPTGALYLHCDPTASHYLKLVLDAIFGIERFQNEIVWCYTIGGKSKKRFAEKHDIILFYSKGKEFTFNGPAVAIPRPRTHMKVEQDADGREYQVKTDRRTKKAYKYYVDEGKVPEDYWMIETLNREDRERTGFPTQKPEALLERIIKASTNENDVVLDAFCGSGTTIKVAHGLKRQWVGIDVSDIAMNVTKNRFSSAFGTGVDFKFVNVAAGDEPDQPEAKS